MNKNSNEPLAAHEPIYFLHIGKTAGNQIKHIFGNIDQVSGTIALRPQRHSVTLRDIPTDVRYFFSIRNPVTRFESGFYSRKRKGWPRRHGKWSDAEREAIENFEHADDLAQNLFEDTEQGSKARQGIAAISHLARHQHSWFSGCQDFLSVRPPVHIIRQEEFERDIGTLFEKLGLENEYIDITEDAAIAHKNDYFGKPELSPMAVKNLNRWYARDFEFYETCVEWLAAA